MNLVKRINHSICSLDGFTKISVDYIISGDISLITDDEPYTHGDVIKSGEATLEYCTFKVLGIISKEELNILQKFDIIF